MKLLALIKKEFSRFFQDPRLIVTMLLPGLVIFIIYSLMGNLINAEDATYDYKVCVSGSSVANSIIETLITQSGSTVEWFEAEDAEAAKAAVEAGEVSAYLVYSENFDSVAERPTVEIYYTNDGESASFYYLASTVLQQYGMRFDIVSQSLAEEADFGMQMISALLPFLIVIFIFSACMSVTLESVAGEKERGTLATILVTPTKRSHIALGKIVPLGCISMIGAASSFLGVAFSMPKLMGVSVGGVLGGYPFTSYLLIFLLIMSVVPLIVGAISAVSAWSKSVKEASAYTGMLMLIMMVVSIVSAFVAGIGDWVVAVPVLNMVVIMGQLLSGGMPVWQSFVSVGANLIYTSLLVLLITKMLSSEKVMFGK